MKISTLPPPVMKRLKEVFGVPFSSGVLVTYGDTVHVRNGRVSPNLVVHEGVHIRQQTEMGALEWWERYFVDKQFRIEQEIEAYSAERDWICRNVTDRNKRYEMMRHIWTSMSTLYDNMCTLAQAKELIPIK